MPPEGGKATIEQSLGGWCFRQVGTADLEVSGKRLCLTICRKVIGLDIAGAPVFNFKWADNTRAPGDAEDSGDILDFYRYGDVAPGARFMFSFPGK